MAAQEAGLPFGLDTCDGVTTMLLGQPFGNCHWLCGMRVTVVEYGTLSDFSAKVLELRA
jgi:hypothetical protein